TGLLLRAYSFDAYRKEDPEKPAPNRAVTLMVNDPEAAEAAAAPVRAVTEGVFFTRNLVSEPADVLTTVEFAERLKGLEAHCVEVEILDEAALEALGMRTLLAVARGSESPARVVVMQ